MKQLIKKLFLEDVKRIDYTDAPDEKKWFVCYYKTNEKELFTLEFEYSIDHTNHWSGDGINSPREIYKTDYHGIIIHELDTNLDITEEEINNVLF